MNIKVIEITSITSDLHYASQTSCVDIEAIISKNGMLHMLGELIESLGREVVIEHLRNDDTRLFNKIVEKLVADDDEATRRENQLSQAIDTAKEQRKYGDEA